MGFPAVMDVAAAGYTVLYVATSTGSAANRDTELYLAGVLETMVCQSFEPACPFCTDGRAMCGPDPARRTSNERSLRSDELLSTVTSEDVVPQ